MEIYNNDEQQAEAIKNWIKENGRAVLLGAAIGLVGMFGWRYYNEYHQVRWKPLLPLTIW